MRQLMDPAYGDRSAALMVCGCSHCASACSAAATSLHACCSGSTSAVRLLVGHLACVCPAAASPCSALVLLQLGQTRWLYLMLWMAKHGNGLVPPKTIMLSARRLRVT